jgi:hypothetical protein
VLTSYTLLGASHYHWRLGIGNAATEGSFDTFLQMLGKGLIFPPKPEQMAGICPVGIAIHEPPAKWIEEGAQHWYPEMWTDKRWGDDPEMTSAVVPHNGGVWSLTPLPEFAFQRVALHKARQWGTHVFATPYGPIAIVPALADLTKVPGVKDWWHTDGLYLWREGGPKLNGQAAANALRESLEKAASQLPFRYTGDDVFFQTIQTGKNRYRVYAIDPGWVEPRDRQLKVTIQLAGDFEIRDLLDGETIAVRNREFPLTVPAGALRILEAVEHK